MTTKQIKEDKFFSKTNLEDLLNEIISSFKETSDKEIDLLAKNDTNKLKFQRSPEIIYGLRNFIGNAIKFSKKSVLIELISDKKTIEVKINDDGPGFPDDVIEIIGEPYIKSKSKEVGVKSGTGLGTFLGKTLLERQSAVILFENGSTFNGAKVQIKWSINDISI